MVYARKVADLLLLYTLNMAGIFLYSLISFILTFLVSANKLGKY